MVAEELGLLHDVSSRAVKTVTLCDSHCLSVVTSCLKESSKWYYQSKLSHYHVTICCIYLI
jgi:hypothetical protein